MADASGRLTACPKDGLSALARLGRPSSVDAQAAGGGHRMAVAVGRACAFLAHGLVEAYDLRSGCKAAAFAPSASYGAGSSSRVA